MSTNTPGKQALLAVLEGGELLNRCPCMSLRNKFQLLSLEQATSSCHIVASRRMGVAQLWASMACEETIPSLFANSWGL